MINIQVLTPLHISGFWYIQWSRDEYETGSLGAGLVLDSFVITKLRRDCTCILNGVEINLKHVKLIRKLLNIPENIGIEVHSPVGLGLGYGVSSAISIGSSILMCILKNYSILKALQLAHLVEVKYMTGFGDVIAQFHGGEIEIRIKPGAPGIGHVIKIPVKENIKILVIELQRKFDTREMVIRFYSKIQELGLKCLKEFQRYEDLLTFFELSRRFSKEVGFLTSEIEQMLLRIDSKVIGYFCKKNLLVIGVEEKDLQEVINYLKSINLKYRIFNLTDKGVKIQVV